MNRNLKIFLNLQAVLDGYCWLLQDQTSRLPHVNKFLKKVPVYQVMNSILMDNRTKKNPSYNILVMADTSLFSISHKLKTFRLTPYKNRLKPMKNWCIFRSTDFRYKLKRANAHKNDAKVDAWCHTLEIVMRPCSA